MNQTGLALALASCLLAKFVHAAPSTLAVEVHRAPEAQRCPGQAELWQSVHALFGQELVQPAASPTSATLAVRIGVERVDAGYQATLHAEKEPALARSIVDSSEDCRGLADGLAVALVLLIEPNATPQSKPASSRPATAERRTPAQPAARRRSFHWNLGLGALTGAGLLGNLDLPSVGGFAGAELHYGGPGLRVRALRLLTPTDDFGPGRIHLNLWAASLGPCWRFQLARRWSMSPCVELGIGSQTAQPRNFEVQQARTTPWRVVTFGVTLLAPLNSLLYAHASLGAALRLHRESFTIDGQVAEEQPLVAPLLSLGISVGGKLGRSTE